MQQFKVGDSVIVLALKRRGIITAIHKKIFFKVSLGSIEIVSAANELGSCQPFKISVHTRYVKSLNFQRPKVKAKKSLDLHGFNYANAQAALLSFISDAAMAGYKEITIIHGHGSGILKDCVHSTLSGLEVVKSYRHPLNNSAETKVYL